MGLTRLFVKISQYIWIYLKISWYVLIYIEEYQIKIKKNVESQVPLIVNSKIWKVLAIGGIPKSPWSKMLIHDVDDLGVPHDFGNLHIAWMIYIFLIYIYIYIYTRIYIYIYIRIYISYKLTWNFPGKTLRAKLWSVASLARSRTVSPVFKAWSSIALGEFLIIYHSLPVYHGFPLKILKMNEHDIYSMIIIIYIYIWLYMSILFMRKHM